PLQNTLPLKGLLGDPLWPPVAIPDWDGSTAIDGLVTHRHPDHYDAETLRRTLGPGARVFCPMEIVSELEKAGLNARGVAIWDTVRAAGIWLGWIEPLHRPRRHLNNLPKRKADETRFDLSGNSVAKRRRC